MPTKTYCCSRVVSLGAAVLAALGHFGTANAWQLTPRVQRYFDNSVVRQSGFDAQRSVDFANTVNAPLLAQLATLVGPGAQYRIESTESAASGQGDIGMAGAAVAFQWPGRPDWQITASAMIGNGSFKLSEQSYRLQALEAPGLRVSDLQTASFTSRLSVRRTDVELSLQRRLSERAALVFGLRTEFSDTRYSTIVRFEGSNNLLNFPFVSNGFPGTFGVGTSTYLREGRPKTNVYSLRFGVVGLAEAGDRHSFFVHASLNVSHKPAASVVETNTQTQVDSGIPGLVAVLQAPFSQLGRTAGETTVGPDITAGYLYRINNRISLEIRYRGTIYFPVAGPFAFNDPRVNHGIAIGASMRLGE